MRKHKELGEQVLVITGATSGIGLTTAKMAADRGARLVLAARNEEALQDVVEGIESGGGEATYVVADVGNEEDVRRIADAAMDRFGGFDTWINNAAVSIYGRLDEISLADHRRVFETNYWGVVHGSLTALEHLRDRGGALINVGSVLSDRAIPEQGPYCATKHALKGFTDALRMEIEEDDLPISVTLIKPSAIDTPYKRNAKNFFDRKPKNPAPVYGPETVARTILHCAVRPRRRVIVGAGGGMVSLLGTVFPRLTDLVMERTMSKLQKTDEPAGRREDNNLYSPYADGEERGDYPHYVSGSSLFTKAVLHPVVTVAGLAVVGAGIAAMAKGRNGNSLL